jgi:hypothetical protein
VDNLFVNRLASERRVDWPEVGIFEGRYLDPKIKDRHELLSRSEVADLFKLARHILLRKRNVFSSRVSYPTLFLHPTIVQQAGHFACAVYELPQG